MKKRNTIYKYFLLLRDKREKYSLAGTSSTITVELPPFIKIIKVCQ
jgi:hypothetical protein